MTIPFLMLLVALITESTLMMSAKVGTVYAAYAAARTASVWSSATEWPDAQDKIERSAMQAMLPFASGNSPGDAQSAAGNAADREVYRQAYQSWVEDGVAAGYVAAKGRSAEQRLRVSLNGLPASWQADIEVTVTYDYPIHVPGLGPLLGTPGAAGGYDFSLTSRVTLPNDGPQNAAQNMGIGYGRGQ
ncbi:MAG: hypothetical protein KDA45_07050 [Planctomycetales bacterium]|nr:hypothetical protein [Planctomycetales bacterium]